MFEVDPELCRESNEEAHFEKEDVDSHHDSQIPQEKIGVLRRDVSCEGLSYGLVLLDLWIFGIVQIPLDPV